MKTQEAISLFGSGRKLAKALKISSKAVYQWGEKVPHQRGPQIREKFAKKIGEDMEKLNADLYKLQMLKNDVMQAP